MRYSQKTAEAAHVSQIQAFMHAEERASISVSLGDQSASVFISFLCAVPEKLTPTDDAHLDHMCTLRLESFFYLWGFSSCEIPSSPYLYWKYHHRSGWRWHLSHHLKVYVWDQGCAGATCHNAPAHRRKCSSHCHHNIHTYTQTNTKCTLATCTCSACLVTLILVCNCVACPHSTVAVMLKVSQLFLFNCVFILK